MQILPLALPLNSYTPRRIALSNNPPGCIYPHVLQIELTSPPEVKAVSAWLPGIGQAPVMTQASRTDILNVILAFQAYDTDSSEEAYADLRGAVDALRVTA